MERKLDGMHTRNFLVALSNSVIQSKDTLDSMDAACGDGDFGSIMYVAFSQVLKALEETPGDDVGMILFAAGQSVLSAAGGASGPMFGIFFIEAGREAKGKTGVNVQELTTMLDKSLHRIRERGGAEVGDKTLVDALEPAVNTLKEAVASNESLLPALKKAAEAANVGCESTKRLVAKHGKARYLGEQTLGFVDPGAYVMSLTFATLSKVMEQ